MTLEAPGICETSISMPNWTDVSDKRSRNQHEGSVVEKSLLLPDSAPELSLRLLRQIGSRNDG